MEKFRDYKVTIGIAPVRRDKFPDPKEAFKNKVKIMARLKEIFGSIHDVKIVDLEWLNKEGMFFETEDVAKIEAYFRKEGVDGLFIPHCNFGQEEVVGKLGKAMGKPFLLRCPRDDAPPPNYAWRTTDVQCGLFASGKALLRYHVPFTYIENCWLDSPLLKEEIEKFVRVVTVMKDFNGMRVGQIALRPRQFHSVIVNEDELLEKFNVEVVPINAAEIMSVFNKIYGSKKDAIKHIVGETTEAINCSTIKPEDLDKMAALELAVMELAKTYGIKAFASECWSEFRTNLGMSRVLFLEIFLKKAYRWLAKPTSTAPLPRQYFRRQPAAKVRISWRTSLSAIPLMTTPNCSGTAAHSRNPWPKTRKNA